MTPEPPEIWRPEHRHFGRGRRLLIRVAILAGAIVIASTAVSVAAGDGPVPFLPSPTHKLDPGGLISMQQTGQRVRPAVSANPGASPNALGQGLIPLPGVSGEPVGVPSGPAAPLPTGGPQPTSGPHPTPSPTGGGGGGGGPVPAPPAGPTMCGASVHRDSGQSFSAALAAEQASIGTLQAVRVYNTGAPAAWPGDAGAVNRPVVVSFKYNPSQINSGAEDSTLRSWFASAPRTNPIYWSYWHEPEDDIANGSFTATAYKQAWTRIAGLARQANNPKLFATLILMGWTVNPASHRNWTDYYAGNSVIDVIGWDVYNSKQAKGLYSTASSLLDPVIAASDSVGKPWGVAEMGSIKVPSDSSGSGRADWLSSMISYMRQHDALWSTYFNVDWGSDDYRLLDAPSRAVWKSYCG
ncbi:MAG TPA: hypothetical protein VGF84_11605 [Micromonosporaceae bacterium]